MCEKFASFLIYHFPTVAFGTFWKWKSIWSWFPFCLDGLLKIYNHHRIPLKKYTWFHYQADRVTSILIITLSRTDAKYIEYILVLVSQVPEFRKMNLWKRKIRHATIVAIFWDNCSRTLRPNLNGEHLEKRNIQIAVTYNNMFLCQITVYLENSRLWIEIWPKERMIIFLRNRHCINRIFI